MSATSASFILVLSSLQSLSSVPIKMPALSVCLFLSVKKPFVFDRSRVPEYLGLGLLSLAVPVALVGFAYASIPSIDLGILLRAEVIFASLFGVVFFITFE